MLRVMLVSGGNTSRDEMEKYHVARVLSANRWHKGESCKILGVLRPRLRRIIKQHELNNPDGIELLENEEITESELVDNKTGLSALSSTAQTVLCPHI